MIDPSIFGDKVKRAVEESRKKQLPRPRFLDYLDFLARMHQIAEANPPKIRHWTPSRKEERELKIEFNSKPF